MPTPLAWHNLLHNKTRTAVAVAGVMFAVVLIFMQLGFRESAATGATRIYQALDFDVLIRSKEYLLFSSPRGFPRNRLLVVAGTPGVVRASPLYVGISDWRNAKTGMRRGILALGVPPGEAVFQPDEIRRELPLLESPDAVLIDRFSQVGFGPQDDRAFGDADVDRHVELGRKDVRIAGHFGLGTGFAADGTVLLGETGFLRLYPGWKTDTISLGLVKLAPGVDPDRIVTTFRERLPDDVETVGRAKVLADEEDYWITQTSIGQIFFLGVLVALAVGTVIVYLVLSSDVANRLGEFATMKALGYTGAAVAGVVLQQAVVLAVVGFVFGLVFSLGLYHVTRATAGLPIEMTFLRALAVLGMSVAMCTASGIGALGKLRGAEPASLF